MDPYSLVHLVIFAILQFFPTWVLVEPDLLILPAVAVLIPFGSLWASTMQTYDARSNTFTRPFLEASGKPKFFEHQIRLVPMANGNVERVAGSGQVGMVQQRGVGEGQERPDSTDQLLSNGGRPGAAHGTRGTPDSAYGFL